MLNTKDARIFRMLIHHKVMNNDIPQTEIHHPYATAMYRRLAYQLLVAFGTRNAVFLTCARVDKVLDQPFAIRPLGHHVHGHAAPSQVWLRTKPSAPATLVRPQ